MVKADVERVDIPSNKAAALGLIVNEIVTNAVKHAFANGRPGALEVSATAADGQATIRITDDGHGMASDNDRSDGLGRTLVKRLSRQVEATTVWEDALPGTRVILNFPVA